MPFDRSRRSFLRSALGTPLLAAWGLAAPAAGSTRISRDTSELDSPGEADGWSRLAEAYPSYPDAVTGAEILRLDRDGAGLVPIPPPHPAWTEPMGHLLVESPSPEASPGTFPLAVQVGTGETRALADGRCAAWAKSHAGDRVYLVGANRVRMQSLRGVFRGVRASMPIGRLPETVEVVDRLSVGAAERTLYVLARRTGGESVVLSVDLASGEIDPLAVLATPASDLQADPFRARWVLLGGSGPKGGAGGPVRLLDLRGGGIASLIEDSPSNPAPRAQWWGRETVLIAGRLPSRVGENDAGDGSRGPEGLAWVDRSTGAVHSVAQFAVNGAHGSPDGRWVVAADGEGGLWIVHAASGERRLLTQDHDDGDPRSGMRASFTPDGRGVLFRSGRFGAPELLLARVPDFESLPLPYERSSRSRR